MHFSPCSTIYQPSNAESVDYSESILRPSFLVCGCGKKLLNEEQHSSGIMLCHIWLIIKLQLMMSAPSESILSENIHPRHAT